MRKIALTLIVAGTLVASEANAQLLVTPNDGRFRDGRCQFERRGSNLGNLFFGFRTSQRDIDRDCRVSSSRTRQLGVWYPVGRDRSGNVIYERRVRDRNGRTIVERARSRDGRTLTRIAANGRVNRDRDRSRDRDWDNDDDDNRRISRSEHDRRKAIEKARRDREKAVRKAQKNRAKAIERARRDAERDARRRTGRGNGRVG